MPWPQDNSPVQPQLSPGMALWKLLSGAVPSQLQSAGNLAAGVAKPFTNLFGNGGQEFWHGPQDPQAAHDMSNALMTMYGGAAAPGAGAADAASLNVGIGLKRAPDFPGGEHVYQMLSKTSGRPQGVLTLTPKGDTLHVNNIGASGPQSIGPDGMRDVIRQLMGLYPDAKTIEGARVSGARQGGKFAEGLEEEDAPLASIRIRK